MLIFVVVAGNESGEGEGEGEDDVAAEAAPAVSPAQAKRPSLKPQGPGIIVRGSKAHKDKMGLSEFWFSKNVNGHYSTPT